MNVGKRTEVPMNGVVFLYEELHHKLHSHMKKNTCQFSDKLHYNNKLKY